MSACAIAEAVASTAAAGAARSADGLGVVPGSGPAIFLGAITPQTSWPVWSVLVLRAGAGDVLGGLMGVVPGWFLSSLTGAAGGNRTGRYWRAP